MTKTSRNDRCPCGSGLKYKHCCGVSRSSSSAPASPTRGMRMKGGVRDNPDGDGFIAIVHMWDNVECRGEPKEWRSPEVFLTEDEAMRYYKTSIRPRLEQMMAEMAKSKAPVEAVHTKLEE